ncbi:MAG TPA: serine/threonine-protein kinase, partial [Polyangiaceae bacterium]|nr:serine/threonine-protein kinase [Polyangiaceae bacterium]
MSEPERAVDSFAATQAQLTAAWDVRGIDIATVCFHRGTAVDESGVRRIVGIQRVRTLPALLGEGPEGTLAQFELGGVLGEGGMGVVRAAKQTALEREVAIKTLREGADPVRAAPLLLREARVTGALDHPNVVPIYALGRDNSDQPLIVMKRIEGTSWTSIIEKATREERKSDAYLREQLAILQQVARAVHFAHSKGIVHRDIKPENVMIGAFGEVYVVDWGIAVSLRENGIRGVPLARDVGGIEGTPSYMAPEMAAADGEHIDERSDIYLLGAALHEILTGLPPHSGDDLTTILTHAFASTPKEYPEHVPDELAAIAHKAMARFNEERHESAAAFAEAIAQFLEHRSSIALTEEAHQRLDALCALVNDSAEHDEDRARAMQTLFSECRFGFQQALRSWSGNSAAKSGLRDALAMMIEFELSRGAAEAAASLLRELDDPPPRLQQRVKRALRRQRDAEARLQKLEHDADLSFGEKLRRGLIYALGGGWCLAILGAAFVNRSGLIRIDHARFAAIVAFFAFVGVALALATRDTMMANATNRRVSIIAITNFFS